MECGGVSSGCGCALREVQAPNFFIFERGFFLAILCITKTYARAHTQRE
jgi:hypothetical protein